MKKVSKIKKLLGLRIKELRGKKGYSQQKLAELVNIDQRNISNIECGNTFPSKCFMELALALDVELKDMFDFSHLELDIKQMRQTIKNELKNLTDDNIRIIYRLIKSMK